MRKTSVYLDERLHSQLKVAAAIEGTKLNDLLVRGAEQVLGSMPDPGRLERELESFRAVAVAAAAERDRYANEVRQMQEAVRRALEGDFEYRKGGPQAESLAFWNKVMFDAARILRTEGRGMPASELLPLIDISLQVEAAIGGARLTPGLLREKMMVRVSWERLFSHDDASDRFDLLPSSEAA